MMHYRKGENKEEEISKEDLPFKDCLTADTNFLWMHVKGGTKVHNVISYAKNALDNGEYRAVIWSGQGGGIIKTVSCAEILKRDYPLYQVTRASYIKVEEHWLPQMEGLEEIVATRQIPSIHILQSLLSVDDSVQGVQKPHTKTEFWACDNNEGSKNSNRYERPRPRKPRDQHKDKQQQQQQQQQYKRLSQYSTSNNANGGDTSASISNNHQSNQRRTPRRHKPQSNNNNNTNISTPLQQSSKLKPENIN